LKDVNGDKAAFAALAKQVAETSEFNLVLMTEDAAVMAAAVEACGFKTAAALCRHRGQCRCDGQTRQGQ